MQKPINSAQQLDVETLARVAGGGHGFYELNPPSALDYLWSNHGPLSSQDSQLAWAKAPLLKDF